MLLFVKTDDRAVFDAEATIQGHRIRFLSVDLSHDQPRSVRAGCSASTNRGGARVRRTNRAPGRINAFHDLKHPGASGSTTLSRISKTPPP